MIDKFFVDTNILVYAYDRSERPKQGQAFEVLDRLANRGMGFISTQVLSEFFVSVTQKISAPLTIEEALQSLKSYLRSWTVFDVTGMIVLEATRGVHEHSFHYWDALIWATARLNQIPVIFSENFQTDAIIEGVQFINPITEQFGFGQWNL